MSEVVHLAVKPPREALRDVVVAQLEDLLAQAKRGEIESLLVMYETSDYDGMRWTSAGTLSRSQTVGRIEILKTRLMLDLLLGEDG